MRPTAMYGSSHVNFTAVPLSAGHALRFVGGDTGSAVHE